MPEDKTQDELKIFFLESLLQTADPTVIGKGKLLFYSDQRHVDELYTLALKVGEDGQVCFAYEYFGEKYLTRSAEEVFGSDSFTGLQRYCGSKSYREFVVEIAQNLAEWEVK